MSLILPVKQRGELLRKIKLAPFTSWRVGGEADRLYFPASKGDLVRFLARLPESESLLLLGLGSNVLIRDGGVRGTVILIRQGLKNIEWQGDLLYVEAGVPAPHLARFCAQAGKRGLEFLAGIPGTVGGALAMNAGAFGGEIWDRVVWVETVDRMGQIRCHHRSEFRVGYRRVEGPEGEWFLACWLRLEEEDGEPIHHIQRLLAERSRKQPRGYSCGSVFKNPPPASAGWLIEQCGLKGLRIGDAVVSSKHANFILNLGQAKAAEIEALIAKVQREVFEQTGVWLELEVRIVGEL